MKKHFQHESSRLNLLLGVLLVVVVVVVILINATAAALSDRYPLSVDLTATGAYDLGPDSREALAQLTEDVNLYVLATRGNFNGDPYLIQMRTLLEKYPGYSSHITLEFIDYIQDPAFVARYPELDLSAGDVVVSGPKGDRQVTLANMFTYSYDAEGELAISGSRAEEALTSAIVSAVTDDPVRVGILTGSAVSDDRSVLAAVLKDNQFDVSETDLVTGDFSQYEVLILLAPMQDLSEDVLARFDAFLYNDGAYGRTLLYAASAQQAELPNIGVFLRDWGIAVEDGAVFETNENNVYGYQPYYPFAEYTDETFRDMLKDPSEKVLLPVSKPLSRVYEYRDQKTVTSLLSFSADSGVRPSDAGENFTSDQASIHGPMPAVLMSTLMAGHAQHYSNVIAVSSAAAFSADMLTNPSIANTEYWISMLNRITERDNAVSIEPKSLAGNALTITTGAARLWGIVLCIAVPVLILAAGIIVYLRRRYQ